MWQETAHLRRRLVLSLGMGAALIGAALALFALSRPLAAQDTALPRVGQAMDWIEPRGINVVDLVGLVPEEHLRDAIVYFYGWFGVALYDSGERDGDVVTLTLRMETGQRNVALCPGAPGQFDTWPSVAPAGTARIYAGDQEITDQASWIHYHPAGQTLPIGNAAQVDRYPLIQQQLTRTPDNALEIPANTGCVIFLDNAYDDVRAVFTLDAPQRINLTPLGSQTMTFGSYIGIGNAGKVDSLRNQMQARFGDRHFAIDLQIPDGADYVLVNFPTTPVNPYGDPSAPISPGGGTYRLRTRDDKLSVDHINTMGLPLNGNFLEADLAGSVEYLPFFSDPAAWTAPEYFVPAGIAYDPCMTEGGCPADLLDAIYAATMDATIYYYDVERVADGLTQIPIKQVGTTWSPVVQRKASPARMAAQDNFVFLPAVLNGEPPAELPLDDPTNCPCGWFDENGAMFAFVPGP